MKKYLLLILVFGCIFLGLGSIDFAQASTQCDAKNTQWAPTNKRSDGHYYSCEYPTSTVCGAGITQQCLPTTEVSDRGASLQCCICPEATTTPPATTPNSDATCATAGKGIWNSTTNACCEVGQDIEGGQCVSATCEADDPDCNDNTNTTNTPTNNGNTTTTTDSDKCEDQLSGGTYDNRGRCVCKPTKDGIEQKAVNGKCLPCNTDGVCCGIELNTSVPFIGKCIENSSGEVGGNDEKGVTADDAFPVLMGSLTQILVTLILIISFVLIIIGGIMIATGNPSGGKGLIMKVVIGIALLGASGVILRLINPNFFG